MMTFCANAIMTPTSEASMGLRLPLTVPPAAGAPPVSPKPENNTFASERFMARAMNRSLANVLFSGFGDTGGAPAAGGTVSGSLKPIEASDVGVMMAFAQKVIIVPGYGMAVAQAQHKVWELCQLLIERGVTVRFAIHPVAGRMPGHMNVLLAEAGVPYDLIADLEEINAEFETADVALIIGGFELRIDLFE